MMWNLRNLTVSILSFFPFTGWLTAAFLLWGCTDNHLAGTATETGNPTSVTGVVLENDDTPIEMAKVILRPAQYRFPDAGGSSSLAKLETTSDSLGKFHFDSIGAGEYVLEVTSTSADGTKAQTLTFTYNENDSTVHLEIKNLQTTGQIKGRILWSAQFDISPLIYIKGLDKGVQAAVSPFSYDLFNVPAGSYKLTVQWDSLGVLADSIVDVTVVSDSSLRLPDIKLLDTLNGNLSVGLLGHWGFDEGRGNTLSDLSGYGNNGVRNGALWSTGKSGAALDFQANYNVNFNKAGIFDFAKNTDFTLGVWIKTPNTLYTGNSIHRILSKQNAEHYSAGYVVKLHSDGRIIFGISDGKAWHLAISLKLVDDNFWHHIAAVRNDSILTLYIDGQQDAQTPATSNSLSNTSTFNIGSHIALGTEKFTGLIDEVRVYDRPLGASEVAQLFALP